MQTVIVEVETDDGLVSQQVFVDDTVSAGREYAYWQSQGVQVRLIECLTTSEEVH